MNDCFMQPSLSTAVFGRVDLAGTLEPLARAGYRWIELSRRSSNRAACSDRAVSYTHLRAHET